MKYSRNDDRWRGKHDFGKIDPDAIEEYTWVALYSEIQNFYQSKSRTTH
jgi:hypothetical protein